MAFDAPNPSPWHLDIPASMFRGVPPVETDFQTFEEAVAAFRWLEPIQKKS
jgi:hypothetical protein